MAESAHSDEVDRDERIARLQQALYGAGSSESERAAAAAELESLRSAARPFAPIDGTTDGATDAADESPTATTSAAPVLPTPSSRPRSHELRWVIGAGAAALAVGLAIGWQLGARENGANADRAAAAATPFPGARTQAEVRAAYPLAASSRAAEVFQRPLTPADTPAVSASGAFSDAAPEYRLLVTRADGVAVFAARDGDEFCLYVVLDADSSGSSCTSEGRFPTDGLVMTASRSGPDPLRVELTWLPDGSLATQTINR